MFSYRLKRPGDLFRWASDIAVDAHYAGRGENPHQRLFDSLGPLACRKKARCVTLRALRRCRCLTPTVVADNPTGAPVQSLSGIAAWAECLICGPDPCKTFDNIYENQTTEYMVTNAKRTHSWTRAKWLQVILG